MKRFAEGDGAGVGTGDAAAADLAANFEAVVAPADLAGVLLAAGLFAGGLII
jgi:hypothetical protein